MVFPIPTISELHFPVKAWSIEELEDIPHLRALAKSIRDSIGSSYPYIRDIRLKNQEDFENFIGLLNHNLIFRLIVTQQYDLLLSLFKDPKEKARWINFLKEMKEEERKNHLKQQKVYPSNRILKTYASTAQANALSKQAIFLWIQADLSLSKMRQWQHYEQELQRITHEYQVQRSQLLNLALEKDSEHISNILGILKEEETKHTPIIEELNTILRDLEREKQVILSMNIYKPDGSIDEQALATQTIQLALIHQESQSRINTCLDRLEGKNAKINKLRQEYQAYIEQENEKLNQLSNAFAEQRAQLIQHLQAAKKDAKQEAINKLERMMVLVKKGQPNENQKAAFDQLVQRLEERLNKLKAAEDFDKVQGLLHESEEDLKKVKNTVSLETHRIIEAELPELESMILDKAPVDKVDELQVVAPESKEENRAPMEDEGINVNGSEGLQVEAKVDASNEVKVQRDMKAVIQSGRRDYGMFSQEVMDEKEQKYIKILSQIILKWERFQGSENFSNEEMKIVAEVNNLFRELKNYNSYEDTHQESLNLILNYINSLSEKHNEVSNIKKLFIPLMNLINDFTYQKTQNNSMSFGRTT